MMQMKWVKMCEQKAQPETKSPQNLKFKLISHAEGDRSPCPNTQRNLIQGHQKTRQRPSHLSPNIPVFASLRISKLPNQ